MTRSSVHGTHLADHSTSDRGMRLLRILVSMTLFFSKSIYTVDPVNNLKRLQILSFEASGCAPEILRAIYSSLDEEDKEHSTVISLENNVPITEYSKMEGHLLYKDKYRKIKSLDLSNLGIDNLPAFIFEHMTNLESLNLSGNANLNLNSETFKSLCQQLTELDVSGCNIDESVFSIICEKGNKLKALNISENSNLNLSSEEFKKLCQQLTELYAGNCNVDEDAFAVICSNCPKLKILRVSGNPRINFYKQDVIRFKDTLEELKVDSCSLDTGDMLTIAGFKSLERLDISNNWLKKYFDDIFDLANLKDTLTELKASKVGITSENLCKITECPKITVLDISHNNLEKVGYANPTAYRFLDNLADQLTSLNVSRANLNIGQLRDILDFPSIETLDCSCNDFSGLDDTFEIGKVKDVLKDASFSNCYLSSWRFLEEILDCPSLTKLDISKNKFEIQYKFAFESSVKSLKWLDISGCEIDVRLFIEILGKSETIEYLDISGKSLPTLLWDIAHTPMKFDFSKVVSTIGA